MRYGTANPPHVLSRAPLIRLLLPLAAGILLGEALQPSAAQAAVCVLAAAVVYAACEIVVRRSPLAALRLAALPTAVLAVLCCSAGVAVEALQRPARLDSHSTRGHLVGGVVESITDRESSTEIIVSLTSVDQGAPLRGERAQIYLDHKNYSVTEGDIICFKADFEPIENKGNPEEFDYKGYMRRHGVTHTQPLGRGQYRVSGHTESYTAASKHIKRKLVNKVLHSPLAPETKYLVCTAVLGDASLVDAGTRRLFSQAGIAHILAISGLHMGIVLALIALVLRPLNYLRLRWLRILLSVAALWGYLYITGSSPSAVRAAVMSTFVMVAMLARRQSQSLNALCAAATLILVFSPMSLHNIGFQLSFMAVLIIVAINPGVGALLPKAPAKRYVVSGLVSILLANLGCAAISAYYFHTLPLVSILSNVVIIIIPVLPVFIGLGAAYTAVLALGCRCQWLEWLLDRCAELIHGVAETAASLPMSHLTNVSISPAALTLYVVLLIAVVAAARRSSLWPAIAAAAAVVAIVAVSVAQRAAAPASGFVILNDIRSATVIYFNGDKGVVWNADGDVDLSRVADTYANFLSKYSIKKLTDAAQDSSGLISPPLAALCGKRIAAIASTDLKRYTAKKPVKVDYLLITKAYYGHVAQLLDKFSPDTVVIAGDVFPDIASRYVDECRQAGVACHAASRDGAILITR